MIETIADLKQFQLENLQGDWIVHVVPSHDRHPLFCFPCIIFIRNILTGKTYYYAYNHPDSKPEFSRFDEIIRNCNNRKWALDKKSFDQIIWNLPNTLDANALSWMRDNTTFELSDYDTDAHYLVRKNAAGYDRINRVVPLMKHKEMFDDLADDLTKLVEGYEPDQSFLNFNSFIIDTLGELEKQGIYVDGNRFRERYKQECPVNNTVYSQYNIYTSTGRPSNSYDGVNYAALNHGDGTRKCFCSRYGDNGCMVVLDYTTFHPRIVSHLVKYNVPVDVDFYAYLAKHYFQKQEIDETDIKNAKALTFRQFYGGIEDKYLHIRYLSNIRDYTYEQWDLFKSRGYVETPFFKRRITANHILQPDPPKVFNYLLQATEGELSIPKVKAVLEYLKPKYTKAVLYTYDAVLYDFYKPEGMEVIHKLKDIMSYNGKFPMKLYMGETYDDVKLIDL